MDAALVMFKIDGSRHEFPLRKSRVVIGRTVSCDLRVPLSSVSRQHCEIRIDNDELVLRDLGSSNGTFVNQARVQEATLQAGDEITIGPVVFTMTIDGKPEDIKPVRSLVQQDQASSDATALPTRDQHDGMPSELASPDLDMPENVEAEPHTPTVELDADEDDPIAALEAMVRANESDDSSTGG